VVFKTHLDVGFTDMPDRVLDRYVSDFFPRAVEVAAELGTGRRGFIWTSGSWILRHALTTGSDEQREAVAGAVRDGGLAWHGLPFTTHTELLDRSLLEYGLGISRELDADFGRTTRVAKMTDVPGHTVGLVPVLADAGIEFLHIGVNPASQVPDVPPLFIWRAPNGAEVVVNYDRAYGTAAWGEAFVPDGASDALYIAFTNDNDGPPSTAEVLALYEELERRHPDAEVTASTLEGFWAATRHLRASLPVVEAEIGDSWIHGPAGDPAHLARFERLKRLRRRWEAEGSLVPGTREHTAVSDQLLLVAEHTWGLDFKKFLPDFTNYRKPDFHAARATDTFDPAANPPEAASAAKWAHLHGHPPYRYSGVEAGWNQQREYLATAERALPPMLGEEFLSLPNRDVPPPSARPVRGPITVQGVEIDVAPNGALVWLRDGNGAVWADADHPIGEYVYETFTSSDYARWVDEYVRDVPTTGDWAIPDLGRPGLDLAEPSAESIRFSPELAAAIYWEPRGAVVVDVAATLPEFAASTFGAPRSIGFRYEFDLDTSTLTVGLRLEGRDVSRLPDAGWLRLSPLVTQPDGWRMVKVGSEVGINDVVAGGNRNMHAVESIRHEADGRSVEITPLSSALVSPGSPRLLRADDGFPDAAGGPHFHLHNTVWGTNFRMWSDDDLEFAFTISVEPTRAHTVQAGSAWEGGSY
jgi:hypothetical protein